MPKGYTTLSELIEKLTKLQDGINDVNAPDPTVTLTVKDVQKDEWYFGHSEITVSEFTGDWHLNISQYV